MASCSSSSVGVSEAVETRTWLFPFRTNVRTIFFVSTPSIKKAHSSIRGTCITLRSPLTVVFRRFDFEIKTAMSLLLRSVTAFRERVPILCLSDSMMKKGMVPKWDLFEKVDDNPDHFYSTKMPDFKAKFTFTLTKIFCMEISWLLTEADHQFEILRIASCSNLQRLFSQESQFIKSKKRKGREVLSFPCPFLPMLIFKRFWKACHSNKASSYFALMPQPIAFVKFGSGSLPASMASMASLT